MIFKQERLKIGLRLLEKLRKKILRIFLKIKNGFQISELKNVRNLKKM